MTAAQLEAAPGAAPGAVLANGYMWRLRSLVAMGHDAARISRALDLDYRWTRSLINGRVHVITEAEAGRIRVLWESWWDKVPQVRNGRERATLTRTLALARYRKWPTPLNLDEDDLEIPGYRPYANWLPAAGTGYADDFPLGLRPAS